MFEKKNKDGKAQWEIVTEVFNTKDVGDVATYEEILEALGPDFPRASLSSVVWHAIRKFRDNKRTFTNVRKVGWRMVYATEHSALAVRQQIRGARRIKDAVDVVEATDLAQLDPEQRRAIQSLNLHLRRLHDQVSRRVSKVEQRVSMVEKVQANTDDSVERLRNLLRRHGIHDDDDQ